MARYLKTADGGDNFNLVQFASALQKKYESQESVKTRKQIGHYGTPGIIAEYMARMFSQIPTDTVRLLDAGAGVGILTAAVCDRIAKLKSPRRVKAVLYENNGALIIFLRETLEATQKVLDMGGHELTYEIRTDDFILSNSQFIPGLFTARGAVPSSFDLVIMNPPYSKLRKDSMHAKAMGGVIHGQPNIYALFMAVGARFLSQSGELVAITPRSYCNGLYFRHFRKWFLDRVTPYHIHLFESRRKAFEESDVLQENMILAARRGNTYGKVAVTVSAGKDLAYSARRLLPVNKVIDDSRGDKIIRISSNDFDQRIVDVIDAWPKRFSQLQLGISTGPVVTFRATDFLVTHSNGGKNLVPLLGMHNIRPFKTLWPSGSKKDTWFKVCPDSEPLILPARNYVILKRLSSKEEKRRLVAGILLRENFQYNFVGLENHLNYVYQERGELSKAQCFGLAALFNSAILDRYFRTINGNTQVNASEIRTLPLPRSDDIEKIGEKIMKLGGDHVAEVEDVILDHFHIKGNLRSYLRKIK